VNRQAKEKSVKTALSLLSPSFWRILVSIFLDFSLLCSYVQTILKRTL
jgi:hypothetical protein